MALDIPRVVVAERLRRQTRNLLGSPRAGSNPADYGFFFLIYKNAKLDNDDHWLMELLVYYAFFHNLDKATS